MKRYRQLSVRSRLPAAPAAVAEWLRQPAAGARLSPPWAPHTGETSTFAAFPGWDHDQRISAAGTGTLLEDQLRAASAAAAPGTDSPLRLLIFRHRQLARDLERHG